MELNNIRIFTPDGVFRKGNIKFGKAIEDINLCDEPSDSGDMLIPGLVDIHTHGAVGFDFSDCGKDELAEMMRYYAGNGVTSVQGTIISSPKEQAVWAASLLGSVVGTRPGNGAKLAGINMEGPFLSPGKRGAHMIQNLMEPSIDYFERAWKASNEKIKLITIAPELVGADELIGSIVSRVRVSLGHSETDYDTACRAFDAGATQGTHLFNAMSPFSHRSPGLIGAAIDSVVFAEIVSDGIHLHPVIVRAAFMLFPGRVCIISDSLRCAGLGDGNYESGGQPITVQNGKAVLADGTLAGSNISLQKALTCAVSFGIPLEAAIAASTINPAMAAGISDDNGSIAVGRAADLVLLADDLSIRQVFIDGEEIV